MEFTKYCAIYLLLMFPTSAKASEEENGHLCEKILIGETDDGREYEHKILVCCPGYTVDTSGKCIPHCERPCIYGFCKDPNVCECNEGYKMIKDECRPLCKQKCINGYCSKPNVCGCPIGFELDDKNLTVCTPICKPKCPKFSKCTKSVPPNPNRCQCITGYFENKMSKLCEPVCNMKCNNGFCSAPETCGCFKGYELDKTNKTNCIPKCDPKCPSHSSCIAPNRCKCHDGFRFNEKSKKCDPVCVDQVKYSICIEPPNTWTCIANYQHDRRLDKCVLETCLCNSNGYCIDYVDKCECYEGFTKNHTTGQCESNCQPNCEYSSCVANNVCQCLDGYHKTQIDHVCEINGLCHGQPCENGECLISGECKCKSGFVKSLSYNGQLQCDKVQIFVVKVMTTILGVPLLLATIALIAVYVIAKKKSYNVEEQEMMLINNR